MASKVGPIVDDLIAQPTLQVLGGSVDRCDVLFGAFGVGQELITEVTHHLAVGQEGHFGSEDGCKKRITFLKQQHRRKNGGGGVRDGGHSYELDLEVSDKMI